MRKLTLSHKEDQTDYDHDGCFHSILKKSKNKQKKKGNAKIKIYPQWNSIQLFSLDKTTVSPFSLRTLKKHENLVTPALYDKLNLRVSYDSVEDYTSSNRRIVSITNTEMHSKAVTKWPH